MVQTHATATESRRILFGGDVMLGRTVAETIFRNGPGYPLGPVAHTMRDADLTVVNLECAITSCTRRWAGAAKAFYFGAPLEAIETLSDAGVDLVSLANNHVLDFGAEGCGRRWACCAGRVSTVPAPAKTVPRPPSRALFAAGK